MNSQIYVVGGEVGLVLCLQQSSIFNYSPPCYFEWEYKIPLAFRSLYKCPQTTHTHQYICKRKSSGVQYGSL